MGVNGLLAMAVPTRLHCDRMGGHRLCAFLMAHGPRVSKVAPDEREIRF